MPEVVAADVATLGVSIVGIEVLFMSFPLVLACTIFGVVSEGDSTRVAPAFPLDPVSTGVGVGIIFPAIDFPEGR